MGASGVEGGHIEQEPFDRRRHGPGAERISTGSSCLGWLVTFVVGVGLGTYLAFGGLTASWPGLLRLIVGGGVGFGLLNLLSETALPWTEQRGLRAAHWWENRTGGPGRDLNQQELRQRREEQNAAAEEASETRTRARTRVRDDLVAILGHPVELRRHAIAPRYTYDSGLGTMFPAVADSPRMGFVQGPTALHLTSRGVLVYASTDREHGAPTPGATVREILFDEITEIQGVPDIVGIGVGPAKHLFHLDGLDFRSRGAFHSVAQQVLSASNVQVTERHYPW